MKLKGTTIGLVPLLVSMLNINGYSLATETNIVEYIENSPKVVADFIEDNFDKMVVEYNKQSDLKWNASYVEDRLEITIDTGIDKYAGIFLDFDEDNGYAVLGKDYTFLDFAIDGESPYKGIESDSYYYSALSGYLYFNGIEYINIDFEKNGSDNALYEVNYEEWGKYKGQKKDKEGCGNIVNTDLYVQDKYGDGWKVSEQKSLPMQVGEMTMQYKLSCYKTKSFDGKIVWESSEGNCWVVSAYNVLQSIADSTGIYRNKVSAMRKVWLGDDLYKSSYVVDYDPKIMEQDLYNKIFDSQGNNISKKIETFNGKVINEKELCAEKYKFPKLYSEIRQYVYKNYKNFDGGTVYATANIINEIGKQHGYLFDAKGTVLNGIYGYSGIHSIDLNLPFCFSVSSWSNAGYGNHTMAGCGYRIYFKDAGWWIFKRTLYKYFYELRDGHNKEKIFFDLSGMKGFGGMVLLDFDNSRY